jgi:hypothetical protein
MRWVLYGVAAYVLVFFIALYRGAGSVLVVLAAPWAPVVNLVARLRRSPDYMVEQAFRQLRAELAQLSPPVVKWYVLGPVPSIGVVAYVACAREADRPQLEHQLSALSSRIQDELRRAAVAETVVAELKLVPASVEMVEHEGGFFAYSHNH